MSQQSIHDRIMSRNKNDAAIQNLADEQVTPKRSWRKVAILSAFAIAVVCAAGYAAVRYDVVGDLLPQQAVAAANDKNPTLPDTPFLQHAKQAGLKSCSTIFPVLGQLLTNGTQYNVQSIWNNEAADKHAVQALVGMNYATQGYNGPAAGIVFAAPVASGCEGSMVRVAPFTASCQDISTKFPDGSKLVNNLGPIGVYALGGEGGDAMLLPTESGCVVISVASATGKQGGSK
ncbi:MULTISPECIES: hypothetical protein [unclassified Rhizobium]|jgi:hypothetical protein|uniref:hypothetical protein n=1 Tax=unclassified Rhizobium TaxID=2613769 RepID=UPI000647CB50|nr:MULTISPECIES: hypothetical protein [unclassified Rhizobium]MBN8954823.1 hypothetical protein [Rhizobium tropici]OJY65434.1 MAG: hypothetical protein BGP09_32900 [Rhizobium sp. 60-20]RKD35992.1 hypothetical protein BJ928_12623 [Rhizobium sp. WW_1]